MLLQITSWFLQDGFSQQSAKLQGEPKMRVHNLLTASPRLSKAITLQATGHPGSCHSWAHFPRWKKENEEKKPKITRHPQMEKHWDPVFTGLILRDFKKMTLPSFSIKSLLIPMSRAQKNKPIKPAHTLSFHCFELCPGCSETAHLPEGRGEGREVFFCQLYSVIEWNTIPLVLIHKSQNALQR